MTDLLEKAVTSAAARSEEVQNRLAATLLAELEMLDWDRQLAADDAGGKLDFLLEEARAAVRSKETRAVPSAE
jgi:hypothetical protein